MSRCLYIGSLDLTPYIEQEAWAAGSVFPVKTTSEIDKELWCLLGGKHNGIPPRPVYLYSEKYSYRVVNYYYTELGSGLTLLPDYGESLYLYKRYGNFWVKNLLNAHELFGVGQ